MATSATTEWRSVLGPGGRAGWVRDYSRSKIALAACITVATGLSWEEALLAFGADPDSATLPWSSQVSESVNSTVSVVATQDAVVAVEYNGWHGTGLEVLVPVSRAGRAASLYWNVDSDMKISIAEAGQLLCAFDPVDPNVRSGEDPSVVDPLIEDLAFATGAWAKHGMIVVERFTGVRVSPEMVAALNEWYVIGGMLGH